MKKISLLGATGSIGTSTLDVIRSNPAQFKLVACSFYSNLARAREIITEFKPQIVGTGTKKQAEQLRIEFPEINFIDGMEGLLQVAKAYDAEILLTAVSGSVGLKPTIAGIRAGKDIALANKETLVMAGHWVMQEAKKNKVKILPVDSEHSAIFQALQGQDQQSIRNLVITASGGSLRDLTREQLRQVTVEQALQHPNWSMGKKITIDSSTMVNKGLEVIEAHFLFGIDYDRIKVLLHPESVVHSLVTFVDGAYLAQMGPSDMREPIQYALTYPKRQKIVHEQEFNLAKIKTLHFAEMDLERFPMLALAIKVGKLAGSFPTVFNAANEVAAQAFLDHKISYLEIEQLITRATLQHQEVEHLDLEQIFTIDQLTREKVSFWVNNKRIIMK